MLLSLHVENLAVIKNIDIDFSKGFSALTGETGAGKSIIIDSINLLLGAKADRDLIRNGENSALVSGVFAELTKKSQELLRDAGFGIDDEGMLIIQRTISLDGKSIIKINGRTATLSILKTVAPTLIAIHGQSDTASLSDPKMQLELLDTYASNGELLEKYKTAYTELESINKEIREITEKESERERLIEILKYQIEDIDSYNLVPDEEDKLIDRKLKIKNSEKITKNAGFAYKALKGSEKGSVSFLLEKSATALMQISDVIPDFSKYAETLRDFLYQVDDIAEDVYAAVSDMDGEPEETLNEIESRLDKISKLKRKYGYTVRDILDFRDKAANELMVFENAESVMKDLTEKRKTAYNKALEISNELHKKRTASAKEIEEEVKNTLEFLDMPKVVFYINIKENYHKGEKVLYADGADSAEFYISANRGAEAQPLSKVASGGELARIMLALKSVIANKDGVSTIIFDEIDTGVSGKTARKIGIKMLSLSSLCQLFAVTHSAQIASLSDTHFLISKSDINGATQTFVQSLNTEGRINELSRIIGGIDVTSSQREAAIDMLNEKQKYI